MIKRNWHLEKRVQVGAQNKQKIPAMTNNFKNNVYKIKSCWYCAKYICYIIWYGLKMLKKKKKKIGHSGFIIWPQKCNWTIC